MTIHNSLAWYLPVGTQAVTFFWRTGLPLKPLFHLIALPTSGLISGALSILGTLQRSHWLQTCEYANAPCAAQAEKADFALKRPPLMRGLPPFSCSEGTWSVGSVLPALLKARCVQHSSRQIRFYCTSLTLKQNTAFRQIWYFHICIWSSKLPSGAWSLCSQVQHWRSSVRFTHEALTLQTPSAFRHRMAHRVPWWADTQGTKGWEATSNEARGSQRCTCRGRVQCCSPCCLLPPAKEAGGCHGKILAHLCSHQSLIGNFVFCRQSWTNGQLFSLVSDEH